ncbi:hypothetical protein CIHG_08622 [Coccidioides immitis H538.4]|uniref:Uncharacterized protein n=1 Tax=Coccidioides immitis H538.4 TaxID=396776 RepID=A0A0J8USZ2_COCIT|nr:hypothetical protein CIHG_08622 [Coccidioides immitis H538.4]
MRLTVSKALHLLAVLAFLEQIVFSRRIPEGFADAKRTCDIEPCEVNKRLPGSPHGAVADLRIRAPPPPPVRPPVGRPGGKPPNNPHHVGKPGGNGPGGKRPSIGIPHEPPARPGSPPEPRPGPYEPRKAPADELPLPFEAYGAKGRVAMRVLDQAISSNKPNVNRPKVDKLYHVSKDKVDADFTLPELHDKIGVVKDTSKTIFTRITVRNDEGLFKEKITTDDIHQAVYFPEARTIQVKESFAMKDVLPDDVRLKWSEITFQNWKSVAGNNVKDLKYILRDTIINEGTSDTITQARLNLKIPEDDPAAFHPSTPGSAMDNAFNSLAGTPNVRSVWHMLADHHREFGDLKIVKIHTYAYDSFLLIELGR